MYGVCQQLRQIVFSDDVTPPILTFTHTPPKSFSSVNISWVTNEKTTGVCEVVGPSFYRSVVCDKTWSGDYLPEGDFTLNVTVYDESLNMAGPFQHKWYNSKFSYVRSEHSVQNVSVGFLSVWSWLVVATFHVSRRMKHQHDWLNELIVVYVAIFQPQKGSDY